MNPFRENDFSFSIMETFYRKFYNDTKPRKVILGINPGRHGAAVTGVPFTDTKRLIDKCGIEITNAYTHEPSSVFVYDVIEAYGGVEKFYQDYYINSICPLGFTINKGGKEVNYNYYDSKDLLEVVYPFIIKMLKKQIALGIETDTCFCLGTGKNLKFLHSVNEEYKFFGEIIPLEHPRYVIQYKSKEKEKYVRKFVEVLKGIN
jgi:hypothetical protein